VEATPVSGFLSAAALAATLLAPQQGAEPPLGGRTIAIDPGHNGGNRNAPERINRQVNAGGGVRKACDTTGAQTNDGRLTESRLNLDVSRRLKARLEADGARVVTTRSDDRGVGPCITERARIGNDANADVAVSIHADGGPPGGRGFHVIYPKPIRGLNERIAAPSRALALDVRAALRGAGLRDATYIGRRGLSRRGDLGGLNLSKVPKVFVEMGNMRNATDARQLKRASHRAKLARAITDGIARHLTG
jgi:N-acetylmuramoyl-L-alanine amidase